MKLFLHRFTEKNPKTQNGVVLLLCLVFLTAFVLLGLSASAEAILQNQLATNLQETERARQSASAALSWAENWLLELEGPAPETCSENCESLFVHTAGTFPAHPEFEDLAWWLNHGHEAGIDPITAQRITTVGADSFNAPLWIIETVHEIPPLESGAADLQVWYRIMVRGSGRTETGISVIESVVTRSWTSTNGSDDSVADTPVICPSPAPASKCGRVSWRELR